MHLKSKNFGKNPKFWLYRIVGNIALKVVLRQLKIIKIIQDILKILIMLYFKNTL